MNYLLKHPKLLQFGIVLIVFFILMSMTGDYSNHLLLRDAFIKKVNSGDIQAVASFSESMSMILRGQLPPQFVRIPEMTFLNPQFSFTTGYFLFAILIIFGKIPLTDNLGLYRIYRMIQKHL